MCFNSGKEEAGKASKEQTVGDASASSGGRTAKETSGAGSSGGGLASLPQITETDVRSGSSDAVTLLSSFFCGCGSCFMSCLFWLLGCQDPLLTMLLEKQKQWIVCVHEHNSLLEDQVCISW